MVMQFPSMGNLQGALPNMSTPRILLRTSSMGRNSSGLMTTQSPSYASAVPTQSPPFVSAMSSGKFPFIYIPFLLTTCVA